MFCSHVRYVCLYVCMYICTKSFLKTTTNSSCVCTHLANKADSDSDSDSETYKLALFYILFNFYRIIKYSIIYYAKNNLNVSEVYLHLSCIPQAVKCNIHTHYKILLILFDCLSFYK